jgi:hypothetical protein
MRLHFILLLLSLTAGLFGQSAWAQVVAPSQGGEVGVVYTTATTMELSFGTTGTGQGRVVAMAEAPGGMPVLLTAVNNQFYTAATCYGQGSPLGKGYAVYNGTGHAVVVSGLKPNTFYYVTNAEYNADANTIAYNTNGVSMSTATRLAATPLPVELTAFTGTLNGQNLATLHWATASERNAAYFALERSTNGVTFAEVGRVAASGNTTRSLNYQWSDHQRLACLTYYRLRQVDTDGKIQYSGVVALTPSSSALTNQSLQVYPNPSAGHEVQLLLQGHDGEALELRLTDALGRLIVKQNIFPISNQYITPLALPQNVAIGNYILTVGGSNSSTQKRITISN